jgi:hypothetical protein
MEFFDIDLHRPEERKGEEQKDLKLQIQITPSILNEFKQNSNT